MKVVGKDRLAAFRTKHAESRSPIDAWLAESEEAEWQSFQDIRSRYPSASLVAKNRIVFNIKGNHYRLDAWIDFANAVVLIVRIGTHEEYDDWTF